MCNTQDWGGGRAAPSYHHLPGKMLSSEVHQSRQEHDDDDDDDDDDYDDNDDDQMDLGVVMVMTHAFAHVVGHGWSSITQTEPLDIVGK